MVAYKMNREESGKDVIWKLSDSGNIQAKREERFMEGIIVDSTICYREVKKNKNKEKS